LAFHSFIWISKAAFQNSVVFTKIILRTLLVKAETAEMIIENLNPVNQNPEEVVLFSTIAQNNINRSLIENKTIWVTSTASYFNNKV